MQQAHEMGSGLTGGNPLVSMSKLWRLPSVLSVRAFRPINWLRFLYPKELCKKMVTLPDHIHFIGGCGRAMSGVMAAVAELGVRVTGSDEEHTYGSARHWLAKLSSGR